MRLDFDSLLRAVAAEDRDVDLTGAVLRSGCENVVVETLDGWILRFPRPGVAFDREMAILRRLEDRLPARWSSGYPSDSRKRSVATCRRV